MSFISENKNSKKFGQRKQLIAWPMVTMFYEDSEGDLVVISEDEDLKDALCYSEAKRKPL